jgi:hypothetical protein
MFDVLNTVTFATDAGGMDAESGSSRRSSGLNLGKKRKHAVGDCSPVLLTLLGSVMKLARVAPALEGMARWISREVRCADWDS